MRKKKLLSETQVRRFMGLAGIKPLNEMSHYKMDDEESSVEEESPMMEEEDMDMDKDMGNEAEAQIDEEKLISAITGTREGLQALEDIASSAGINVDGGMEGDMDDEPDMDMDMDAGDEDMDMDMDAGDEDIENELEDVDVEPTEDEIVAEVARRVAKRIVEAKRAHQKMNEALGRGTAKSARPKLRRR